jgi:hypothetical protein
MRQVIHLLRCISYVTNYAKNAAASTKLVRTNNFLIDTTEASAQSAPFSTYIGKIILPTMIIDSTKHIRLLISQDCLA